jgi:hypothetical protein
MFSGFPADHPPHQPPGIFHRRVHSPADLSQPERPARAFGAEPGSRDSRLMAVAPVIGVSVIPVAIVPVVPVVAVSAVVSTPVGTPVSAAPAIPAPAAIIRAAPNASVISRRRIDRRRIIRG